MGFFDSLRRTLGVAKPPAGPVNPRRAGAWNVDDEGNPLDAAEPEPFHGGAYDKKNWLKKLKMLLEELPASQSRFADHIAEAHALGFDPEQMNTWTRDEFAMLVRHIVADRVVTEAEHRNLELARQLLDIPDAEAEAILHAVVAEAEKFFGGTVQGVESEGPI
jgi:hypothetical protein